MTEEKFKKRRAQEFIRDFFMYWLLTILIFSGIYWVWEALVYFGDYPKMSDEVLAGMFSGTIILAASFAFGDMK
jgi:polyferredoxin